MFDAKPLVPSLEIFFALHPSLYFKYYLGDSDFDAADNLLIPPWYNMLICLNPGNKSTLQNASFTNEGIPLYPNDRDLPILYTGIIKATDELTASKYMSRKINSMIDRKKHVILECNTLCTKSLYSRFKTCRFIIDIIAQCQKSVMNG